MGFVFKMSSGWKAISELMKVIGVFLVSQELVSGFLSASWWCLARSSPPSGSCLVDMWCQVSVFPLLFLLLVTTCVFVLSLTLCTANVDTVTYMTSLFSELYVDTAHVTCINQPYDTERSSMLFLGSVGDASLEIRVLLVPFTFTSIFSTNSFTPWQAVCVDGSAFAPPTKLTPQGLPHSL